jgi:hypothetical protein
LMGAKISLKIISISIYETFVLGLCKPGSQNTCVLMCLTFSMQKKHKDFLLPDVNSDLVRS